MNAVHELALQIERLMRMNDPSRGITVQTTVIAGGTVSNVVPDSARALVDIRISRMADAAGIERKLHSLRPILKGAKVNVAAVPEALGVCSGEIGARKVLLACGYDARAVVYALLDLADRVQHGTDPIAALVNVPALAERPSNEVRSISRLFVSDVEGVVFAGRCDGLFDGEGGESYAAAVVSGVGEVEDSVTGLELTVNEFAGTVRVDPLATCGRGELRNRRGRKEQGYGGHAEPRDHLRSLP